MVPLSLKKLRDPKSSALRHAAQLVNSRGLPGRDALDRALRERHIRGQIGALDVADETTAALVRAAPAQLFERTVVKIPEIELDKVTKPACHDSLAIPSAGCRSKLFECSPRKDREIDRRAIGIQRTEQHRRRVRHWATTPTEERPCQASQLFNAPRPICAPARSRRQRRANSSAKRWNIFVQASTERDRRSRRSRLDCPKRAGPECHCNRPRKARHRGARVKARSAIWKWVKESASHALRRRDGAVRRPRHCVTSLGRLHHIALCHGKRSKARGGDRPRAAHANVLRDDEVSLDRPGAIRPAFECQETFAPVVPSTASARRCGDPFQASCPTAR